MSGAPAVSSARPRPASRRTLGLLFALALGLRLVALVALDTPGAAADKTPWAWGGEAPTLAASLEAGRGLADPWRRPHGAWAEPTGPSGWLTPVYPALVAAALRLGGGVGPGSAWLVFGLQAVASALTACLVVRLAERLGLRRAAPFAGLLFALHPLAIWNAVAVVWDTTLVALGLTAFLVLLLSLGRGPGALFGSGLVFGALLFLNPAPVAILPAVLFWVGLDPSPGAGPARLRRAALGGAAFCGAAGLVLLPWMLRNQRVLGTWQLRPNFGVELRIGNHDGADGRPRPFLHHPSHVEAERERYIELGEAAYGRENAERAAAWIRAHPREFLALTVRRVGLFWWGELPSRDGRSSSLAPAPEDGRPGSGSERGAGDPGGREPLAPRRPATDPTSWIKYLAYALSGAFGLVGAFMAPLARDRRFLVLAALVLSGVPYYLTHVSERYRFPIDPVLVTLAAWLVLRLVRGAGRGLDSPPAPMD